MTTYSMPIGGCCRVSAAMLRLADSDGHTNRQRAKFRAANDGQAKLLDAAAGYADELAAAAADYARLIQVENFPKDDMAVHRAYERLRKALEAGA